MSDMGVGPKCIAYGGTWRAEEYIEYGEHPTLSVAASNKYRRLVALYLAKFHR